jgi:hypothetical protein
MRTLGQLKTRTADLVAKLSCKSIAQKSVGLSVQRILSSVATVAKKSRLLRARTNSIAIWSAEIKAINIKQASKQERGKVTKHPTQQFINGSIHTTKNQMFANTAIDKVTQSGQTYHRSIIENVTIGLIYVNLATLSLMARTTKTLEDISNQLPDNWEELTPAL